MGEEEEEDRTAVAELREKMAENDSIRCEERAAESWAAAVEAVKELRKSHLFVVGRTPPGHVAEFVRVKSDFPELGPVGNLLISSEFSTSASVLIVQQHHIFSGTMNPP